MVAVRAVLLGWTINASRCAAPTVMSNELLVAPVRAPLVATSVYPIPARLIDRLKVAVPLTALTVVLPVSVAPVGLFPKATVIGAVLLVTVLPPASWIVTQMPVTPLIVEPARVVVG